MSPALEEDTSPLGDVSAQTVVRVATLRLAISPNQSVLTTGQPVLLLVLDGQAYCRVAARVPDVI